MNKPVKINEVEKVIRKRLREELPNCKFYVRTRVNAFNSTIDVHLMSANFEAFTFPEDRHRFILLPADLLKNYLTLSAREALDRAASIIQSLNLSGIVYVNLYIGKPDQPFELLEMEEHDS